MNKKLYVRFWPIFWRFLIIFVVSALIAFFGLVGVFISYDLENMTIIFLPWEAKQIIVTIIIFFLGIGILLMSLFGYYYVIEKDHFLVYKLGRVFQYDYKNIMFIDVEKSKKQNVITFYTPKAKMQYLLKDRQDLLLETLLKKCTNTVSLEEFRRLHPEEKY